MESYGTGVRRRMREMLVIIAQTLPLFVVITYLSTPEKALVTTMAFFSIWTAVSMRWDGRHKSGFWWIVGLVIAANAAAIWSIPMNSRFSSGYAVAYPVGMAEGFGVYWLLGWWIGRGADVQ